MTEKSNNQYRKSRLPKSFTYKPELVKLSNGKEPAMYHAAVTVTKTTPDD